MFLTNGCHCTRYNFTLETDTTFSDIFTCRKGSPTGSVTTLPNHGSFPADEPGKMKESLGPVSPPYWVLKVWPAASKRSSPSSSTSSSSAANATEVASVSRRRLQLQGEKKQVEYAYSLVYACVGALGFKAEYLYFFSRTPEIEPTVLAEMHAHLDKHSISYGKVKEVPMEGCKWD